MKKLNKSFLTRFVLAMVLLSSSVTVLASFKAKNSSGTSLGIINEVKCSTGMTCTSSGRVLTMVASPTIAGSITLGSNEVISNATDDTVKVASEDNHTTLQVYGFEAKNAILELAADESDDSGDSFFLKADTSDVLHIMNESTDLLQFSAAGVMTLADSETVTNASDVVAIGADDNDLTLKLVGFEAKDSILTLQADESDDSGDDWQIKAAASGNALTISNDVSGSQVAKLSISTGGNVSGTGAGSLVGFLQNQIASSTTTLTIAQCGSTIVSGGAHTLTLPEASTALGCRYTFIVGAVAALDVDPADGTDQIVLLTNAAGDRIEADAIGESVTIEAIGANTWAPVGSEKGTWSDAN